MSRLAGNSLIPFLILVLLVGCREVSRNPAASSGCEYAGCFDILFCDEDSSKVSGVVSISPFDGSRDTLLLGSPIGKIVCMSTSDVAALSVLDADFVVVAVSGIRYVSDPDIRKRYGSASDPVYDIGAEHSIDYERIVSLQPDVVTAYVVGKSEPPFLSKLRSLGLKVFIVYNHLEEHPLARAEYVRLFGAMTGRLEEADAFFSQVRDRYLSLSVCNVTEPVKVLINAPYSDAWYIPGKDSYMSTIIRDAGGAVLGSSDGFLSSVISLEDAYLLSLEADVWLCPGHSSSREELSGVHHLFPSFGPLEKGLPICNNNRITTPGGGNDFWESGSMRPDLVIEDLRNIFDGIRDTGAPLHRQYNYFLNF